MRGILIATAAVVFLAGCSSSSQPIANTAVPSPTITATTRPTKAVTYTSGSAQVSTTGAQTVSFTAPLDTLDDHEFKPDFGFEVWWRSGEQAVNVSGDLESGEVDAFVRIETGSGDKNAYIDPWHTVCQVTLTQYDEAGVAGSFTCKDMPSFDDTSTIDATGTFAATA